MAQVMTRGGPRRRRTMNEINMVPFIDVMLVLLIIFMVSAPLIATSVIDVPSVGQSKRPPEKSVIEVVVGLDERIKLRIDGQSDAQPVSLPQLAARVKQAQRGNAATPVVISAERKVAYEAVVRVMDTLQRAGVQRVGLSVKQGA
jgi:biopolymer transport protein TolR